MVSGQAIIDKEEICQQPKPSRFDPENVSPNYPKRDESLNLRKVVSDNVNERREEAVHQEVRKAEEYRKAVSKKEETVMLMSEKKLKRAHQYREALKREYEGEKP